MNEYLHTYIDIRIHTGIKTYSARLTYTHIQKLCIHREKCKPMHTYIACTYLKIYVNINMHNTYISHTYTATHTGIYKDQLTYIHTCTHIRKMCKCLYTHTHVHIYSVIQINSISCTHTLIYMHIYKPVSYTHLTLPTNGTV